MTGRGLPHLADAQVWEYCRIRYPQEFASTAAELADIRLSYLPNRGFASGVDLDDVAADLRAGLVMEERSGTRGPYYVMSGSLYDVYANPSFARDAGHAIADVSSVKTRRGLNTTSTVRPANVAFHDKREEAFCDLAGLLQAMEQGRTAVRRRLNLRHRLLKEMDDPRVPDQPMGDLGREAREHYAALRMMLDLVARRSRLAEETAAAGTVIGQRADEVYVRLSGGSAGFVENRLIEVDALGVWERTRLRSVEEMEGDLVLCMAPPRGLALAKGARVRLRQDGQPAMRRHREALDAFLAGAIEGDWQHLALLLCRPGDLPPFEIRTPARFLTESGDGRRLNAEQRAAVAGALSTPHAYLVQGPPGTGKSTVITELVLQLVARGERVLLLAPMHVAVDEVLGRVADQPGVFALRVAVDERKVRDDLHRLLPDRVAREYLETARTQATSRAGDWQAEIDRLAARGRLVGEYLGAVDRTDAAAAAQSNAEVAYASWRQRTDRASVATQARLHEARTVLDGLTRDLAAAHAHRLALQAQVEAQPAARRLAGRVLGLLGSADGSALLSNAHRTAVAQHEGLFHQQRQWLQRHAADLAELERLQLSQAQRHQAYLAERSGHDVAARAADEARQAAARALAAATGADPALRDLGSWRAEHQSTNAWMERLRRRIGLERRWFALSGLTGGVAGGGPGVAGQFEAELRQAANVICATTTGVVSADLGAADFDTMIVDEASRVVDSEFLIGAVRARRWILVGDQQQLPPYVEQKDEHHLHALTALHLAEREGLDDETAVTRLAELWREEETSHTFRTKSVSEAAARLRSSHHWPYYGPTFRRHLREVTGAGADPERTVLAAMRQHLVRSLFERNAELMPDGQFTALRVQHRSIAPIAALVREPVYKGQYDGPPDDTSIWPFVVSGFGTPVVFADTSARGDKARDQLVSPGFRNELEAQWVRRICGHINASAASRGETGLSVSVLTFYRHQARRIKEVLADTRGSAFPALDFRVVDVIDRIQGQESDVVIISFCRAYTGRGGPPGLYGAWLQDLRRLNVAVTRARRGLFLVGHVDTLSRLRGVPGAEEFYRNMFELIRTTPESMTMVHDL